MLMARTTFELKKGLKVRAVSVSRRLPTAVYAVYFARAIRHSEQIRSTTVGAVSDSRTLFFAAVELKRKVRRQTASLTGRFGTASLAMLLICRQFGSVAQLRETAR